ncbi:MAG: hypothetical protein MSB80_00270 [Alphaproteobacteria bacterium]|nr:hypothetical protein [Alphaproteobacteria bacterium]
MAAPTFSIELLSTPHLSISYLDLVGKNDGDINKKYRLPLVTTGTKPEN